MRSTAIRLTLALFAATSCGSPGLLPSSPIPNEERVEVKRDKPPDDLLEEMAIRHGVSATEIQVWEFATAEGVAFVAYEMRRSASGVNRTCEAWVRVGNRWRFRDAAGDAWKDLPDPGSNQLLLLPLLADDLRALCGYSDPTLTQVSSFDLRGAVFDEDNTSMGASVLLIPSAGQLIAYRPKILVSAQSIITKPFDFDRPPQDVQVRVISQDFVEATLSEDVPSAAELVTGEVNGEAFVQQLIEVTKGLEMTMSPPSEWGAGYIFELSGVLGVRTLRLQLAFEGGEWRVWGYVLGTPSE